MAQYIPKRNEIIWLDFEPVKGKEIGKYRLALVLSSKEYNQQTALLICCPISTNIRGQATEVPLNNLDKPSVVASSLIQSLSWKDRIVKKITASENSIMEDVLLLRLFPLIGSEPLFDE